MPSSTSAAQANKPTRSGQPSVQPQPKLVTGQVVARRVLTVQEREREQARLAQVRAASQAAAPRRAAVAAQAQRQAQAVASSVASSSSNDLRGARGAGAFTGAKALATLKQIARAIIGRHCAICGLPISGRALKLEAGPVFVEIHPACADPVKRAQHAVEWLNRLLGNTPGGR